MPTSLEVHQSVHLQNPHINYVRLENCEYCKFERRVNYRNRYRANTSNTRNTINYNFISNLNEYNPFNYTFYNMLDEQNVETPTCLRVVNRSSKIEKATDEGFCSICQDKIEKGQIIRKINCGHQFHWECCDKWLETKNKCPTCRFEI